jgi:hypothetical protein
MPALNCRPKAPLPYAAGDFYIGVLYLSRFILRQRARDWLETGYKKKNAERASTVCGDENEAERIIIAQGGGAAQSSAEGYFNTYTLRARPNALNGRA